MIRVSFCPSISQNGSFEIWMTAPKQFGVLFRPEGKESIWKTVGTLTYKNALSCFLNYLVVDTGEVMMYEDEL